MIIKTTKGDILINCERRIVFAINTEGINDGGFSGMVSRRYWSELAHIGKTKLGTVLTKKVDGIEFFAICCHSLEHGWHNQKEIITQCFDAIPGDEPVASIAIGTGFVGAMQGADFKLIKAGMEASKKKIILYNND